MPKMDDALVVHSVYGNMAELSGHTGIPAGTIRMCKASGCREAFSGTRVYLLPLLRWIFSKQNDDADIDWGVELKKEQAKREKIKRAKDERSVVDRVEMAGALNKGVAILFGEMDRRFTVTLPPVLKGMNESQLQERMLLEVEEMKDALRKSLAELLNENEPTDNASVD